MYSRISAVLLTLLLTTTQCKKDNESDNRAKELQGSWKLAYTFSMYGYAYPAPGSLSILKFDGYKMLTYAHDTLLKTEPYFINMQKDASTQATVPCIIPTLSSSSEPGRAFSIYNDTLKTYLINVNTIGSSPVGTIYTRYNP